MGKHKTKPDSTHLDGFVDFEDEDSDDDDFQAGDKPSLQKSEKDTPALMDAGSFMVGHGAADSFTKQDSFMLDSSVMSLHLDSLQSKVKVGSVIHAINGELVALKPYNSVMALLRQEVRPLVVTFRQAPEKAGTLTKQPTSIVNDTVKGKMKGNFKKWKAR